jgi:hypothetical protein
MANTAKVLGQLAPSAATWEDLYTVPASTNTVVSSIVVCNRDMSNSTFRLAVRPAGASLEVKHYQYYETDILHEDTFIATIGMTLEEGDVISVYVTNPVVSFTAYGQEQT